MTASVPIIPRSRPISAPATTMCFARYLAKRAVKARMQAAGIKTAHIEVKIVTAAADAYLDQHRAELLAEAAMTIDSVPGLRKLAEAEAKRRAKVVQKTSLQQQAKSSTATKVPRALPAHTAIDRLSNRRST
jgi:hypothetical protein